MSLYLALTTGPLAGQLTASIASRDDATTTALYNVGRTKLVPTLISNLTVIKALGLALGTALLDAISANPNYKYIGPALENGLLDVSDPLTQAAIDGFVPLVLTQGQADTLKNLARVSDPVSVDQVSAALNGGSNV